MPSNWPESSLLPSLLTLNLFSVPCLASVGSCVDIRPDLCPSSLCSLIGGGGGGTELRRFKYYRLLTTGAVEGGKTEINVR